MHIAPALFALVLLLPLQGHAAEAAGRPDELLEEVTTDVLADLKQLDPAGPGAHARIVDLVVAKVVPVLDLPRMTQIAVGRNWRLATAAQQLTLVAEFSTLLVRTYSTALLGYRDHAIAYRRLRLVPEDVQATVRSEVTRRGGQGMSVDYDMEKGAAGWKVYDIKLAGVSLVTTYRDSFADEVRQGGVDGLVKSLAAKNRQGDSRFRKTFQSVRELSLRLYAYVQGAFYRP
jgi:phospholipid transport system substrate-binding protein